MSSTGENDRALLRSGTRLRASVRCLPRGQFQQIRQMFDRFSIVGEQRPSKSDLILGLSVTDDEKWQQIDQDENEPLEKSPAAGVGGELRLNVRAVFYLSIDVRGKRVTSVKVDIRGVLSLPFGSTKFEQRDNRRRARMAKATNPS